MYFSLFRKIAASLLAKTILIDTALASNPSKEQEFHPQRRKCRSISKRNNSSERNTIGIVNGHLGVVGRNADVLYFNWRHRFLAVLKTMSVWVSIRCLKQRKGHFLFLFIIHLSKEKNDIFCCSWYKTFPFFRTEFYQRWCFNLWNIFSQVIDLFSTNQYLFLSALHGAIIMTIMMTMVMMTMISAMMMMYKIFIADHRFRYSLLYSLLGFFTTTLLEPYTKSKNPTRFSLHMSDTDTDWLTVEPYFLPSDLHCFLLLSCISSPSLNLSFLHRLIQTLDQGLLLFFFLPLSLLAQMSNVILETLVDILSIFVISNLNVGIQLLYFMLKFLLLLYHILFSSLKLSLPPFLFLILTWAVASLSSLWCFQPATTWKYHHPPCCKSPFLTSCISCSLL